MSGFQAGVAGVGGADRRGTGTTGGGAALEFLTRALERPFEPGEIRIITLAAPRSAPERLLRLPASQPATFWDAASGPTFAGWGAAALLRAEGRGRFEAIRDQAGRLWPRVRALVQPGIAPLTPRLFGGFSFLPAQPTPEWRAFGQATFVLPRLVYSADEAGGHLAVAVERRDLDRRGPERLRRSVGRALRLLGAAGSDERPVADGVETAGPEDIDGWTAAVDSIRRRIAAGRAEKIAAARVTELRVPGGAHAAAVLRRLRTGTAAEVRFAFRFGGATFLGATPERLVSRRGRMIRTEALAGSIDADRADRAEELLASSKDAAEHAYVVRAIAEALSPLCARLDHPPEPRIQRLRHVLHLQTPFEGELAMPTHVLELVQRLHPTPAVGGTPTAEALAWIAEHEGAARGWYAAPVGWFDAGQDGEFFVALRSALLTGDRALLYAGAGIVRDSDPRAELEETRVKLRTMAGALGWTT